jgi:broad specificity phosphatase PhoE
VIAGPHGLPVRLAAELDEINFGAWTGQAFAELDGQPEWDRWNACRSEARCPGGESMAEAQARAVSFAFEAAARHDGAVVLVTHCDIIRGLLCWQERRSLNDILSFEAGPASVTELTLVADVLELA